jgi:hypothetical protein
MRTEHQKTFYYSQTDTRINQFFKTVVARLVASNVFSQQQRCCYSPGGKDTAVSIKQIGMKSESECSRNRKVSLC